MGARHEPDEQGYTSRLVDIIRGVRGESICQIAILEDAWLFLGVNFRESPECELRLNRVLRRLMSNCGKRGRSRNSMLALNLRPKVVPHGPRLLLGLIVRISGRLVAGRPRSGPEPPGSSG